MAKEMVVNNEKVTDMLKKMFQIGDTFFVDINKQVHNKFDINEPIYIQMKDEKIQRKLYIYDTNITDPEAIILNPLAETMNPGAECLTFYSSLTSVLSQWVYRVVYFIVTESIRYKDCKDGAYPNTSLIPILTPFIDKVDSRLATELEKIREAGLKDFCTLYYNRSQKSTTMLIGIEDDGDYIKQFPASKIRKKTWSIIEAIFKFVLDVPADKKIKEVYHCKTEKVECPIFTTYSDVWIRVWEKIMPYMDLFDGHESDMEIIESLKEHFSNIPVYRECTMWLKQPTPSSFVMPSSNMKISGPSIQTPKPEASWKNGPANPTGVGSNIVQLTPRPSTPSWMNNIGPSFSSGYNSNIVTITRRGW